MNKKLFKLILSAMFLAIALLLPLLTGQMQQLGNMLCPMHFPVILCGFFCGPWYALGVGFIAPLLRFLLFGMPTIMPIGIAMSFELATYGLVSGLLYKILPKKKLSVYISLIIAMVAGRVIWGIVETVLLGASGSSFGWAAFITGAVIKALPGIALQIILIPIIVLTLKEHTYKGE